MAAGNQTKMEILDSLDKRSSSNSGMGLANLVLLTVAGSTAYFVEEQVRAGNIYTLADLANSKVGSALSLDQSSLASNTTDIFPLALAASALLALYFAFNAFDDLRNSAAMSSAERRQAAVVAEMKPN